MFNVLGDISWLAVLVATVVTAALAGVYFALLVPRFYVIALGRQDAPAPKQTLVSSLGPVVCILVTTITSAVLLRALTVTAVTDAVVFGLVVGIGYLTAMTFQIAINPNFPRPLFYGLINAPFFVASGVITSVILVLVG